MAKSIAPLFRVAKLISGPSGINLSQPFFIVETTFTSDGMRDRICDGRWATEESARDAIRQKIADMGIA